MKEIDIQNQIRLALNPYMIVFDMSIGSVKEVGDIWIKTGLPKGFSDLFGVRKSDGRAVFIEVKRDKNSKPRKEQVNFLNQMRKAGAICGVARSAEDAINIIKEEI